MSERGVRAGVRRLFRLALHRPDWAADEADAELESVLQERVDFLVSGGMAPDAARAEALGRLGDSIHGARARLQHSAERRERHLMLSEWLDDLLTDGRYALRSLRRSPAVATAAILTLALAIGANTAIFSAVNAVMIRPLPFQQPDRLVALWEKNPDFHWYQEDAAPANYIDWQEQVSAFADVAAYPSFPGTVTLTGSGAPRLLPAQVVTGNFFEVLGIRPFLGRTLRPSETWSTGGPSAAVLSYRCWRDVFGADRGLVGRTVQLDGQSVEVAGVLPERFAYPGLDVDVWQAVGWDPTARTQVWFRRAHFVRTVARLKPGATAESANAAFQAVVTRLEHDYPATNTHMGAGLTPLHDFLIGSTRLPLLVMFGSVAVLLLIACANVGNLLLVRAAGREREAALRLALGAGRGRLVRMAFAESLVLATLGGAAGVALGGWGTRILVAMQPPGMLPVQDLSMNWGVLAYAVAGTALSALLFGIAPAVWMGRRIPADALHEEGRTASGSLRSGRLGDAILVCQVALAIALTLGAGLLVRSYLVLQGVAPGFESQGVLAVRIVLPGIRFDSTRKVLSFYDELEARARALPGVEAAALVSQVPLGPPSWSSQFSIAGHPTPDQGTQAIHRELSREYHKVMRVPLLRGRFITDADRREAPYVVLINETLARTYFQGENPIGQRVAFDRIPDSMSTWRTIIGVVADERQASLAESPQPEFVAPYSQEARSAMTLLVRTRGDPATLGPAVRQIVAQLDPGLAISSMQTMDEVRMASLARDRFLTALLLSFALVGVVLGLVGVYGVVAQLARRRTREMGIRIALGARVGQVQWIVVRHGVVVTLLGVALGVGAALATTGALRTLLYHVAPTDPATFVLVPLLALVTSALASWLPAIRVSRADPSDVLRSD